MMNLVKLDWDTEFFGYPVSMIKTDGHSFDPGRLLKITKNFKLVYIQSADPLLNPYLTQGDRKVVFSKKPKPQAIQAGVRVAQVDHMESLVQIGLESGVWSRFSLDPKFTSSEFHRLYSAWVKRSVVGEIAYTSLTVLEDGKPAGLITLGDDGPGRSSIGLFAVADGHRGKGIGKRLLLAAENLSALRHDAELTVATQGKNETACAVYQQSGFQTISETYIYHYWNEAFNIQ